MGLGRAFAGAKVKDAAVIERAIKEMPGRNNLRRALDVLPKNSNSRLQDTSLCIHAIRFAEVAILRRALFSALIISSAMESSTLALRTLSAWATREVFTTLTLREVFFLGATFGLLIAF